LSLIIIHPLSAATARSCSLKFAAEPETCCADRSRQVKTISKLEVPGFLNFSLFEVLRLLFKVFEPFTASFLKVKF
jgi:hypothetical protein